MSVSPFKIFKNVKMGERFVTYPIGSGVFTKVVPTEKNNRPCNAVSDSKVYGTWIYDAEMVVIQKESQT